MVDTESEQRRSNVRGQLTLSVRYRLLTSQEYEKRRNTLEPVLYRNYGPFSMDSDATDSSDTAAAPGSPVVDLLTRIDEKLSRILSLLSTQQQEQADWSEPYGHSIGSDISGSGMSLEIDEAVEPGQIFHTSFLLSRLPYVHINLFGEVVHVTPLSEEGEMSYSVGIRFIDPDEEARDRIIARVFEVQRKAIRNSRDQDGEDAAEDASSLKTVAAAETSKTREPSQ